MLKVTNYLFINVDKQTNFTDALVHLQPFAPCILRCQNKPDISHFAVKMPTFWQPDFVDRLSLGEKPGQHSLHQQGYFYCLYYLWMKMRFIFICRDVP